MGFVRNVVADLVEKRLWPVAVALLVALVAIPLTLGSGGDAEDAGSGAAAPAPVAVPAVPGQVAAVGTGEVVAAVRRDRAAEPVRDPFVQQHRPKEEATATATSAAARAVAEAAAKATGGSSSEPRPAPAAPAPSAGTSKPSTTPKRSGKRSPAADADDLEVYRVKLRFGTPTKLETRKDVARLTPLPSAEEPHLVFLGLLKDRRTAVFLLSSDVKADGDGTCRPSRESCETLELEVGDSELLEVDLGEGETREYQLEVLEVDARTARSKARAAQVRRRESARGRKELRARKAAAERAEKVLASDGYSFDAGLGLLRREKPEETLGAHLPRVAQP